MPHPPQPAATPVDSHIFRRTIGQFVTGVTVIGTGQEPDFYGMTANAITSVSLDPLLVLVCVGKESNCAQQIQAQGGFSINILKQEQESLSVFFADMWPAETPPPPFEFEPWQGGPRLKGSPAALGCSLHELFEGGDHWIVVGRVLALHLDDLAAHPFEPLIYYRGRYRHLQP